MKSIYWVFWPSFIAAVIAEAVFFLVIDPQELFLFGEPVHYSPMATYSIGFFAFWTLCAASSLMTVFLQRDADTVNRRDGEPTAGGRTDAA